MRANVLLGKFGNCSVNVKTLLHVRVRVRVLVRVRVRVCAHTSGGHILKRPSRKLKLLTVTDLSRVMVNSVVLVVLSRDGWVRPCDGWRASGSAVRSLDLSMARKIS